MSTMTMKEPVAGTDPAVLEEARQVLVQAWRQRFPDEGGAPPSDEELIIRLTDPAAESPEKVIAAAKVLLEPLREARFAARQEAILADVFLPDAQKELYLDRTIMRTRDVLAEGGMNAGRLSLLRAASRALGHDDHPGAWVLPDTIEGRVWNRLDPGVERGRWLEWRVLTGRSVFNVQTGKVVHAGTHRHGRAETTPK